MRRTKEDAQKTRSAILDAAANIFAEKGPAHASLEEIAKAANVTRGAVYWHFKDKGEIFNSLHERLYQPLAEVILQDLSVGHTNPLQQLCDLCIKLLLELPTDAAKRQTMMLFLVHSNYTGDFAKFKDIHLAKKTQSLMLFSKYFEKAKEEGNLPDSADPLFLTLSIQCYMKGIIIEYLNDPQNINLEKNAKKLVTQFFKQYSVR